MTGATAPGSLTFAGLRQSDPVNNLSRLTPFRDKALPQHGHFASFQELSTGISGLRTRLSGEKPRSRFPLVADLYATDACRSPAPMSYVARDDRPADKAARYAEV